MDVKVEAGVLSAKADLVSVKIIVEVNHSAVVNVSAITRFSFAPVISIGGTSISSITPQSILLGVGAA